MPVPTYFGLNPLRKLVCSGVPPPQMQAGSRFPLYSSLACLPVRQVPRCGVPLQLLTCVLLLLSVCLTGCDRSIPFDKSGWQERYDGDYPKRDAMVKDLLDNQKLTGLTTRSITDFLGEEDHIELHEKPKSSGVNYMSYQVLKDFGWDIDPVHTKYLVIEFNEDSIVTKVNLLEWKQR
ncbi:MAG: hypothetical protein RBT71_02645 [Flavobacteriales bacterium]|jgi:hypothetical protein|nr:hypothetical protein [Flavobacteriales bacterium]